MKFSGKLLKFSLFAIVAAGFVIWSISFIYNSSFITVDSRRYFCLFDDAMISMHYAWNLSHGLGLVWNPNAHIQGYTNLLMTLLMAGVTAIFDKLSAVLCIQILGIVFMLSIAWLSVKISDYLFYDELRQQKLFISILTFICVLFYYPLAYWSLMGMETGLLTFLLLAAIYLTLRYLQSGNPKILFLISLSTGLAYLTRNDSIIFFGLIWTFITWKIFYHNSESPIHRLLYLNAGVILLFIVGQFSFQYIYYGELLPNTYVLKLTGMPLYSRIGDGIGFVTPFLTANAFILGLIIIDIILNFRILKLLLFSIFLSSLLYQVYVGGDPWAYWRIMSPAMPLVFILFTGAAYRIMLIIINGTARNSHSLSSLNFLKKIITGALILFLIIVGLLSANESFWDEISFKKRPFQADDNQYNVNTAILLNHYTTTDATLGVYWAGAIPYFTGRYTIDFLGKSDKYIAGLPPDTSGIISWNGMNSVPGHNKYNLNYSIKKLQPTYVQGFKYGRQDLSLWSEKKYTRVYRDGVILFFLNDSPSVLWSKLNSKP